jgi:hypothetical protein
MLGAFNMPKYDWLNDTPLSLPQQNLKKLLHAISCFLGLNQQNSSVANSAVLKCNNF